MANIIKQGFQEKLVELVVEELFPTKSISICARKCRKYAQVLSSIREVGLIEAPVVAPLKKGKGYLLLDGHLRIMALKELGVERVACLISTDDETYTYNKYINRLSAIQEHRMIVKAVQSGVSEEKLARVLNLDIGTIRNKKNLLEGICPEAVELLKDTAARWRTMRRIRDTGALATNKDPVIVEALRVPNAEIYAIDVSFPQLKDKAELDYLNQQPTSFVLPPEAVDRLRAAAGTIILASPEFQRLLKDVGARIVSDPTTAGKPAAIPATK